MTWVNYDELGLLELRRTNGLRQGGGLSRMLGSGLRAPTDASLSG